MTAHIQAFLLSFALSLTFANTVTHAQVTVTKNPPTAEQKVLDPRNPPPEKAKVAPNHPAFTWSSYTAHWFMHWNTDKFPARDGKTTVRLTIISFDLTLDLRSTLWLPAGSAGWVVRHEQGHQAIAKRSYRSAETIARQLARELIIGHTFEATASDAGSAEQAARDKAGDVFLAAYLKAIRDPAQCVHVLYDEITNHGNNHAITEEDAVQQAIDRYRAERESKRRPATTMATTPVEN